ncbi:hypothetical protein BH11CYA1_BH11CYA1_12130 [soil metagenome]
MMVRNTSRSASKSFTREQMSREEKRKFVDIHPAAQASLPRNVDKTMFGHSGADKMEPTKDGAYQAHMNLSEQFLSGAGGERSTSVLNWMDQLKSESEDFINGRRDDLYEDELKASLYRSAVTYLVDKIFQDLRWFAFEYNKVAAGTALQISSSILGEVTEVTRANRKREAEQTATYFRARLANRRHSLVIRGSGSQIEFYIVPVSQVMALSIVETEFAPVATMQIKVNELGMSWRLRGAHFSPDTIEELSMGMFARFVEATKKDLAAEEQ